MKDEPRYIGCLVDILLLPKVALCRATIQPLLDLLVAIKDGICNVIALLVILLIFAIAPISAWGLLLRRRRVFKQLQQARQDLKGHVFRNLRKEVSEDER